MMCKWCGNDFEKPHKKGPTPKYCKRSCRQRDYEMRKLEKFFKEISKIASGK